MAGVSQPMWNPKGLDLSAAEDIVAGRALGSYNPITYSAGDTQTDELLGIDQRSELIGIEVYIVQNGTRINVDTIPSDASPVNLAEIEYFIGNTGDFPGLAGTGVIKVADLATYDVIAIEEIDTVNGVGAAGVSSGGASAHFQTLVDPDTDGADFDRVQPAGSNLWLHTRIRSLPAETTGFSCNVRVHLTPLER